MPTHNVARNKIILGILLLFLVLFIFTAGMCYFLSFTVDIDLNSGQLRRQTKIGSLVIAVDICDTPFSQYVAQFLPKSTSPEWRCEQSTSIWAPISPHYRYHGTVSLLEEFMLVTKLANTGNVEKKKAAMCIINMLKKGDLQEIEKINASLMKN